MQSVTGSDGYPARHPDPEVDAIRPYISAIVTALKERGVGVTQSWLDPKGPIDATIKLEAPGALDLALVWDEDRGCRLGVFKSGRQGERTVLHDEVTLDGAIHPEAAEAAAWVKTVVTPLGDGTTEPAPVLAC